MAFPQEDHTVVIEDDRLRSVASGVGLGILLFLAYWKFSRGCSQTNTLGGDLE